MMGRNRRRRPGRRGSKLKAVVGIGAAVVVGGGAIGAVAVASTSHAAVTKAASAGYSRSYSYAGHQGNILNAALADYSWSHARAFTQFSKLANTRSETEMWHGRVKLAFERGRVVLATKQFVLIRAANGTFNVWFLSHGTKVTNVSASQAGTTALTGSRPAAAAAMAGQLTAATATVSGSTAAAQKVLAPTATTVSVNIAGTGVTVSVTTRLTVGPSLLRKASFAPSSAGWIGFTVGKLVEVVVPATKASPVASIATLEALSPSAPAG